MERMVKAAIIFKIIFAKLVLVGNVTLEDW